MADFKLRMTGRHSTARILHALREVMAEEAQKRTRLGQICVGVGVAPMALGMLGVCGGLCAGLVTGNGDLAGMAFGGVFWAFFATVFTLVLGAIFWFASKGAYERRVAKDTFVVELIELLRDDLPPDAKLGITFDRRDYDAQGKRYWSGRSQHGNAKHRYDDQWLDLRFTLMEGTRVKLKRSTDIKTRKGGVMKNKRRGSVTLMPPRPLPASEALEVVAFEAVAEDFHDPPEGLRVEADQADGQIKLKVMQLNAEILPSEMVALLNGALALVWQSD